MILSNSDTLYGNLNLENHLKQMRDVIEALKQFKKHDIQEDVEVNVRGQTIYYYPARSTGSYLAFRVWMDTGTRQKIAIEFRIFTKEVNPRSNLWPIELVFRSVALWTFSFTKLWEEATRVLRHLVLNPEPLYSEDGEWAVQSRISRIDWAVDTDELELVPEDAGRFLSRARYQALYLNDEELLEWNDLDVSMHHIGTDFTGLAFGKGAIHARIYNKWLEISKKRSYKEDKRFFGELWKTHGWLSDRPVWRLEIQLRREALYEIQVRESSMAHLSIPETMASFPNTLTYWFGDWLTLRQPNEDPNRSRWPIDPVWQHVIEAASVMNEGFARIPRQIAFDELALAQSITGLLSSYALAVGVSSPQNLMPTLAKTLAHSFGLSPAEWFWKVQSDLERKATKYGMQKEDLHIANET